MKNIKMAITALTIVATSLLVSFKSAPSPSVIKGKVSPSWYAVQAWAISETDTLYTTVDKGTFDFSNAKPGVYRIIIEARSPYRHIAKDGVVVKEGEATDIELALQKY